MIKHYKGILGEFNYDDEEFNIDDFDYLHYIGKGLSVDLPEGCIDTSYMFENCVLPEGFTLGNKFNTSNVYNMQGMFMDCKLPEGFTLGNNFDTSKVKDMSYMFCGCILPEGFLLGNKFDTNNVKNMRWMFSGSTIPEGFILRDHFNSYAEDTSFMFNGCKFAKGMTAESLLNGNK